MVIGISTNNYTTVNTSIIRLIQGSLSNFTAKQGNIYTYIHTCINMYMCVWTYACTYVCVYARTYVCIYASMFVCTYVYDYVSMCICTCVCVCTMYVYKDTLPSMFPCCPASEK